MRRADGLDDHELLRDVNVYALADYFEIDKLKAYSLKRFSSKINNLWVSEAYPIAIREVYSNIPAKEAEPRNAVVSVAKKHFQQLLAKPAFRDLLREGGDFVVDLGDHRAFQE